MNAFASALPILRRPHDHPRLIVRAAHIHRVRAGDHLGRLRRFSSADLPRRSSFDLEARKDRVLRDEQAAHLRVARREAPRAVQRVERRSLRSPSCTQRAPRGRAP